MVGDCKCVSIAETEHCGTIAAVERGVKSVPHTPRVLSKIRLCWLHGVFPAYQRCSGNVIREICRYLQELPGLHIKVMKSIYRFDCEEKRYKSVAPAPLQSVLYMTEMSRNEYFLILEGMGPMFPQNYCLLREVPLPFYGKSTHDRLHCGAIYDKQRNCVYIFGGQCNAYQGTVFTKTSMKLECASNQFLPMSDLVRAKSGFGTCWHKGLVFLCGGSDPSIQTFAPGTGAFADYSTLGQDARSPFGYVCSSLGEELVVSSSEYCWIGKDEKLARIVQVDLGPFQMAPNGNCVVCGHSLVFSTLDEVVMEIDFFTGKGQVYDEKDRLEQAQRSS